MIEEKDLKKFVLVFLAIILAVISFFVIKPVLLAIFAGLLMAYVFNPVYKVLFKVVKRKNTAAFIMCLLILVLIFVPLWFLTPLLVNSIFDFYLYIQKINLVSIIRGIFPSLFDSSTFSNEFGAALNNLVTKSINYVINAFSDFMVNLPRILIQMAVALFVFFFALRDSDKLGAFARSLSPFNKDLEDSLITKFKHITFGIIYGQIIVGIVQGILTGIGYYIFGVPRPMLLMLLTILASIIPFIGAWLIWIPASIILIATGNTTAGIGLFIYGAAISWVEHIMRAYIVSKPAKVHSVIIFVGIIGGLIVFDILGIFLGPLILSYLIILIDLYKQKKLFA